MVTSPEFMVIQSDFMVIVLWDFSMGYHRLQLRCELNRHTCHTCFRDMGSQESCAEIYPRTVHWNCTSKWEVSHISMGQNQLYRILNLFSV